MMLPPNIQDGPLRFVVWDMLSIFWKEYNRSHRNFGAGFLDEISTNRHLGLFLHVDWIQRIYFFIAKHTRRYKTTPDPPTDTI